MLKLVDVKECSTKGGDRKYDRKKADDKLKEKETKIVMMAGYKYRIYWDKKQHKQKHERIVEEI